MKLPVKFDNVDVRCATIYVALNLKPQEILEARLENLIPRMKVSPNYKGGKNPSVLTIWVDQKGKRDRWSWVKSPEQFSEEEQNSTQLM